MASRWHERGKLALLLLIVVGAALVLRFTPAGEQVLALARRIAALGGHPAAPWAYAGVYAVAVALGMPGSALTLLGGVAFGLWRGFVVNLVGGVLGAGLAFWMARLLGREAVVRLVGRRLASLDRLERPGAAFRTFLRLRLIALIPYNALNFAAGVTRAPFLAYLAGTAVGIIPSTFLWTYFADVLVHGDSGEKQGAYLQLGVALLALLLLGLVPSLVGYVRGRTARRS